MIFLYRKILLFAPRLFLLKLFLEYCKVHRKIFGGGVFFFKKVKVGAFIRVKNEIETIAACLKSIEGVFDYIVIIYVDRPDDGTIAFLKQLRNPEIRLYAYPYEVYPPYDIRYILGYDEKKSLAAYYNFGLSFFGDNDWVFKIDADQVYIKHRLQNLVMLTRLFTNKKICFGAVGINTYPRKTLFGKAKICPYNGMQGDSFIIQKKHILGFIQGKFYEILKRKPGIFRWIFRGYPIWFHFNKEYRTADVRMLSKDLSEDYLSELTLDEIRLWNRYIKNYFSENHPYTLFHFRKSVKF